MSKIAFKPKTGQNWLDEIFPESMPANNVSSTNVSILTKSMPANSMPANNQEESVRTNPDLVHTTVHTKSEKCMPANSMPANIDSLASDEKCMPANNDGSTIHEKCMPANSMPANSMITNSMPANTTRAKYISQYQANHYDLISTRVAKGGRERLKDHANLYSMSLNAIMKLSMREFFYNHPMEGGMTEDELDDVLGKLGTKF